MLSKLIYRNNWNFRFFQWTRQTRLHKFIENQAWFKSYQDWSRENETMRWLRKNIIFPNGISSYKIVYTPEQLIEQKRIMDFLEAE